MIILSEIDVNGIKVPLKVVAEHRKGSRASLGSTHVILRIPISEYKSTGIESKLVWLQNWLCKLSKAKPFVFEKYNSSKSYEDGGILNVANQSFKLALIRENRSSGIIRLTEPGKLEIKIPSSDNFNEQKLIRQLIIKFCQKYFIPYIHDKVRLYNEKYFNQEIGSVKLKYNKSNWGSCSNGRNLNFSVRLLLAPDDVIDYVVVHELAHLLEMNHSPRYWKIVESVMPDYKVKEKYLKEFGSRLDF